MKSFSFVRASARPCRHFLRGVWFATLAAISFCILGLPMTETPLVPSASADSVYFNLTSGNLNFSVSAATVNQITSNDNWTGVGSVEGYFGQNLTATHGVDPQTVLGTEFASNQLPSSPTNVAANKGNPSAFNAGGVAEFDSGTYLAIGLQGNVQANPYLVFYLNTTGRSAITINYEVQDIDSGSNNSVSPIALQYRVGETGLFTNLPAGYIADVTTGGVATPPQLKSVVLPIAAEDKPQVQIRLLTTNAANSSGGSTPDEWIGVNNVTVSSLPAVSAANVSVGGRAMTADGNGIRGARVTLWNSSGETRQALTGPFGYYSFDDVEAGQTYILEVSSKRHSFVNPVIVRTINDNISDIDFVAEGSGMRTTFLSPPRSGRD